MFRGKQRTMSLNFKGSKLVLGLTAVGALSFAGFVILYFQRKKRQRAIERRLKGVASKKAQQQKLPTNVLPQSEKPSIESGDTNQSENSNKTILDKEDKTQGLENNDANSQKQDRRIQLDMPVSRDAVGSLIGRSGDNIRKIQRQTNTKIVPRGDDASGSPNRVYTISGTPDAVGLAESLIKKHIMSLPVLTRDEIEVPEYIIGRIIGHQGERIRAMQDQSLARIEIPTAAQLEETKLFTDDDYEGPKPTGLKMRKIIIKGTEEHITAAKKLIMAEVDRDATLRTRILQTTSTRTHRQDRTKQSKSLPLLHNSNGNDTEGTGPATMVSPIQDDRNVRSLRQDKTMEVFVSCVYHPNEIYIQLVNEDMVALDKLCIEMTEYYKNSGQSCSLTVGNIVAAKFTDGKMYRAKILNVESDFVQVKYVDFGDQSQCHISDLYKLQHEFLKLRFQATLATLNLECLGNEWTHEAINETVTLTKSATWQRMKAKVLGYLKDASDQDVVWLEIYDDADNNIADSLIRQGLAGLKENQPLPMVPVAPIVKSRIAASFPSSTTTSPETISNSRTTTSSPSGSTSSSK